MRQQWIRTAIEAHIAKLVPRQHEKVLSDECIKKRREAQAKREYRELTGEDFKGTL